MLVLAARASLSASPPTIAPIVDRGPHKVEIGDDYRIVRMHHPRSEQDAEIGPSIQLLQLCCDNLVIVHYAHRQNAAAQLQLKWIEEAMPALAKRSKRPLVLLDVTGLDRDDQQDQVLSAFMPAYLCAMESNQLDTGKRMPFDRNKDAVLPYGFVTFNGFAIHSDFSLSLYPTNATVEQLRGAVLSVIIRAVKASNEQLASGTPAPVNLVTQALKDFDSWRVKYEALPTRCQKHALAKTVFEIQTGDYERDPEGNIRWDVEAKKRGIELR